MKRSGTLQRGHRLAHPEHSLLVKPDVGLWVLAIVGVPEVKRGVAFQR
ncbi:hypothetical protein TERTU_1417 [Teredinibacter turnerae T7901]|uniref:Uncharacterized protein n=1 Tax=Teredinibacter turnerae (strain ATCC 39867 / T7901) TaxID=377629 RepID=C5BSM2_TERTT|nr:hypothetical protein TERTU_1417 [Teredinibacter turnerae T7901]